MDDFADCKTESIFVRIKNSTWLIIFMFTLETSLIIRFRFSRDWLELFMYLHVRFLFGNDFTIENKDQVNKCYENACGGGFSNFLALILDP